MTHRAAAFQKSFHGRMIPYARIRGSELAQTTASRRLGEQGSKSSHRTCYSTPQHSQVYFEEII